MNLVDSSGWISWFTDDRNADAFANPIEDLEHLVVSSITLTEAFKFMSRQSGEGIALQCVAHMNQGLVVALDGALALDAAVFGLEHKLPLADSIIYATARKYDATIWTQDADFRNLPGVEYFP